jgi:hypothetical protein
MFERWRHRSNWPHVPAGLSFRQGHHLGQMLSKPSLTSVAGLDLEAVDEIDHEHRPSRYEPFPW